MDTPTPNTTRELLLAHAEKLIRTRGCNGFSYRDLAEHVGVKTSSIHYYFPGKDDLLYEAVEAYSARALGAVRGIDPETGHHFDDTKRYIDGNKKLSAADRAKIFEGNTRRVFPRFPASL